MKFKISQKDDERFINERTIEASKMVLACEEYADGAYNDKVFEKIDLRVEILEGAKAGKILVAEIETEISFNIIAVELFKES